MWTDGRTDEAGVQARCVIERQMCSQSAPHLLWVVGWGWGAVMWAMELTGTGVG